MDRLGPCPPLAGRARDARQRIGHPPTARVVLVVARPSLLVVVGIVRVCQALVWSTMEPQDTGLRSEKKGRALNYTGRFTCDAIHLSELRFA